MEPCFRVFLKKCLSKYTSSMKPPLPLKICGYAPAWRNNTKIHVSNEREIWLPCEWILPLNGMRMPWYYVCSLILFLFWTNGKKGHLDEYDFRHCYGNFFSKVEFWKLLHHSYVQSSFSTITRHIEHSILKDTLQLLTDLD